MEELEHRQEQLLALVFSQGRGREHIEVVENEMDVHILQHIAELVLIKAHMRMDHWETFQHFLE